MFPGPLLFTDVMRLGQTHALSVHTDPPVRSPIPPVFFFIAGFSCKSVSGLNPSRASYRDCAKEGVGTTGQTLAGALSYICRYHPVIVAAGLSVAGESRRVCRGTTRARRVRWVQGRGGPEGWALLKQP